MRYARTGHVERHRATYSRKGGVRHIYEVYDLERDTLVGRFIKRKNRRTFLAFVNWLRGQYRSTEVLHIVLDNAIPWRDNKFSGPNSSMLRRRPPSGRPLL